MITPQDEASPIICLPTDNQSHAAQKLLEDLKPHYVPLIEILARVDY